MSRGGGGVPHRIYIVPFSPHILMPKVRKNLLVRAGIEPGSSCFTSDHKNMANHANGHINGFISSSFVTYDLVWRLAVFLIFKKGLITNYIVKIIDKRLSCYIFYSAALNLNFGCEMTSHGILCFQNKIPPHGPVDKFHQNSHETEALFWKMRTP